MGAEKKVPTGAVDLLNELESQGVSPDAHAVELMRAMKRRDRLPAPADAQTQAQAIFEVAVTQYNDAHEWEEAAWAKVREAQDRIDDDEDVPQLPPIQAEALRGRYANILLMFARANELFPSGIFQFNMSRCWQRIAALDHSTHRIADFRTAVAFMESGRRQVGEKERKSVDEELAKLHFQLGLEYYNKDDWGQARAEFNAAWTLTHRPAIRYNQAKCAERLNDWDAAIFFYTEYLRSAESPKDADAVRASLLRLRRTRDPFMETFPDETAGADPKRLFEAGQSKLAAGDAAGAAELIREAHRRAPDRPKLLFNLAVALSEAGQVVEARYWLELFLKLVAQDPDLDPDGAGTELLKSLESRSSQPKK